MIMGKKTRILNKAELKRKEIFEAKEEILCKEGYKKKDLTINVVTANIMSVLITIPILILFFWIYHKVNGESEVITFEIMDMIIFLFFQILLFVIHEIIHGITWAIYSENHFRDIEFGVIWKMITPYCTCKSELTKRQYIIGGIMPTILLGIIPAIITIIFNRKLIFIHSMLMIIGGGGDILILLKLLFYKGKGEDSMYLDHPYECGLVVFEKDS